MEAEHPKDRCEKNDIDDIFSKTYFSQPSRECCRTEIVEHLTPSQANQKLSLRWSSLCTNIPLGKVRIDGGNYDMYKSLNMVISIPIIKKNILGLSKTFEN